MNQQLNIGDDAAYEDDYVPIERAVEMYQQGGLEQMDPDREAVASPSDPSPASGNTASGTDDVAVPKETPAGVYSRDKEHIIPHEVLATERAKNVEMSRRLQEAETARVSLMDEVSRLRGIVGQGGAPYPSASSPPSPPTPTQAVGGKILDSLSAEEREIFESDNPTSAKILEQMDKKLSDYFSDTDKKVAPLAQKMMSLEEERARAADAEVQAAIDRVPKLAYLQAADPDGFNLAASIDQSIRDRPEWAGVPLSERFTKVAQMVEMSRGKEIVVTDESKTSGTRPSPTRPSPSPPSPTQAGGGNKAGTPMNKAKLDQALAEAVAPPYSMSEIAGGRPPAESETQALSQMSTTEIAQYFDKLRDSGKLDSYLAEIEGA